MVSMTRGDTVCAPNINALNVTLFEDSSTSPPFAVAQA